MIFRSAVIGCGRIGCGFDDNSKDNRIKTHARSYFVNPRTNLVSLCDVDKSKLQKYGRKYHVTRLYTDSLEMFKNENLDLVSICTLVDSHLDLVKQAVNSGVKGIFLEKPVSNDLKSAKKIIELCDKNNVKLIINHRRRFDPFFHSIKSFLESKKLGNIQLVNVYYGGGIANTCSHIFDVLRMLFGEIKTVNASESKNESGNKLDPNLDVSLTFMNGVRSRLQALDTRNYGVIEIEIFGSLGRLKFDLESNNIEYSKISSDKTLVYKNLEPSKIKINYSKHSSIYLGLENLVRSLSNHDILLCTGMDGYKSLELIIASQLSSKNNKVLCLPIRSNYKISSK